MLRWQLMLSYMAEKLGVYQVVVSGKGFVVNHQVSSGHENLKSSLLAKGIPNFSSATGYLYYL